MNLDTLIRADLNLLVTFQLLMEERSVSKTAERMHLTQPAISKTLKKLREEFNDPLFSRTSQGLVPTAKALALQQQLPELLSQVDQFFKAAPFDPKSQQATMRIASSDSLGQYIPELIRYLQKEAPGIKLENIVISENFVSELRTGGIDFVIHPTIPLLGNDITRLPLDSSSLACVVGEHHPLADRKQFTLDEYLAYPHIRHVIPTFTQTGFGIVDEELAKLARKRNIILETHYLTVALNSTATSNSILTIAEGLTTELYTNQPFTQVMLPAELKVEPLTINLYYHQRVESSSAHEWLRDKIIDDAKNQLA